VEETMTDAPAAPGPVPAEAAELICYDDDVAIGKDAPSLSGLEFIGGDSFDVGGGKVTVITHFGNLNKADYVTLTVLSDFYQKYKDDCNFVAISRDHDKADAEKWYKKYNGTFMKEQTGPNGESGANIRADFPVAYDSGHALNASLKTVMGKSTVGVGLTIIVGRDGKIAWYETFGRGKNLTGQFEYQLNAIVKGTPLHSNGNAPEIVEEEVEGGEIQGDVDLLGGGDGNY